MSVGEPRETSYSLERTHEMLALLGAVKLTIWDAKSDEKPSR